ncbi:MAG: T9SS type A sorting domain-containing protein [Lewinellaceae bacterium]|nr:T9SS type A sorting domain-containing protein [Lewinellaceae bacterium]
MTEVENAREFESYENIADPEDGGDGQNHPERRPRLVIYYSSPSSSVKSIFNPTVQQLKVYPNPARPGLVNVELENDDAAAIRLFNSQGQLLRTIQTIYGKTVSFQTGNLPTGTYYIQGFRVKNLCAAVDYSAKGFWWD